MFVWKNRMFCLHRIVVLVSCKQIDMDKAIEQALRFIRQGETSYSYCINPDDVTADELWRLRRNAEVMIDHRRLQQGTRDMEIKKAAVEGGLR